MSSVNSTEALARIAERLRAIAPGYDPAAAPASDRQLIDSGAIAEPELCAIYADAFGVPVQDEEPLAEFEPGNELPLEFCQAKCTLVLEQTETCVTLLVPEPYSFDELQYLLARRWAGCSLKPAFVRRTLIERLIGKLQSGRDETDETIDTEDENTLRTMAGEARIVRLVNDIFTQAMEQGASDIHFEPGEDHLSVRCRIDGVLTEIMALPLNQFPAIASRIKLIGGLNIAESRLPQDGRTNIRLGSKELDMRISTIPILTGESIVLRLLNQEAISFDLRTLGMTPEHLKTFEELITLPHGMILVVGPTGSGKTTTLYSVINQLNDMSRKIITIEDPVEYKTRGLCQMQVNPKIGVTFAAGLRHIVRQDPDVILVGEIRDRETADIAINAALTGHVVLSTLHTNDAVGAVTRLVDMGVENFLISSSLFGVLSQRLVRKICPECHGSGRQADDKCRRCNGSGYKGRCGIFELLLINDEMRSAINRNASSAELQAIAVKCGMVTLREDGEAKVAAGVTTAAELGRATADV